HPGAARLPDPGLPGLPGRRLRLPQVRRRTAPTGARRARDPRPRLQRRSATARAAARPQQLAGQPGPQRRRVPGRRAGQARPGALPAAGGALRPGSAAQPLGPGSGLLPGPATETAPARRHAMMRALFCLTLGLLAGVAQAVEIRHWQRLPLGVPLAVGHERVIFLDQPVRVGLPPALSGKLRVQSANGALYLLASAPFSSTRLQLQLPETGELILLDLTAETGRPALEPLRIVHTEPRQNAESATATPPTPIQVALVR